MVPYLWFILSTYYLFKRYFLSICYVPGSVKGLWDLSMNKPDKDSYPQFSSVAQSCPTFCDPQGLQHARLSCPSLTPRACSNSCALSLWWCLTISASAVPFSSHLQSFPASESFPMSQFFASGGKSSGVSASASVLPITVQDWFPLGWTGWISK